MAEKCREWATARFIDWVHAQHPAPRSAETGELLWEKGIRLHGATERVVKDGYRFVKVDGGVRSGKSFNAADRLYVDIRWMMRRARLGPGLATCELRWGVIGDSYRMAEEEMNHLHRLLNDGGIPHEMNTPQNQSWKITFAFCGAVVETLTAADVSKIASKPYRGMVIAEAAQTTFDTYIAARNRVVETGGWVHMEGTFESAKGPWYAVLTERWKREGEAGVRYAMPSWENPVVFPGGWEDPKIQTEYRELTPDVFNERYGGEPKRPQHVAIPQADVRWHVKRRYPWAGTSFDPELPVYLAIDPGTAHAYAVLAVQFEDRAVDPRLLGDPKAMTIKAMYPGRTVWVIDAIYRWGRETREIVEEVVARPWSKNVAEAVIDFAGRQRRSQGAPDIEQWMTFWFERTSRRLVLNSEQVPLQAGYEPHKRALLNGWPEDEAELTFDRDGKMGGRVVDEDGMKLFYDPEAAPCMFGGKVDGQDWAGEYNLHRMVVNNQGTILRDEYRDTNNDAIKAMNYLLWHHFGASGYRQRLAALQSVPWELTLA